MHRYILFIFLVGGILSATECGETVIKGVEMIGTEWAIESFDKVALSGTLRVADSDTAVAITVHGSFSQDRNGDLDGTQEWMFPMGVAKRAIFKDVDTTLQPLGVGTYRYDKRASGKSGGVYKDADIDAYAKDLIAVFDAVSKKFPDKRVFVVGQSEGAITILRAHQMGLRPAFMVLQGPALDPLEDFLEFQKTRAAALFLQADNQEIASRLPYLAAFYLAYFRGDLRYQVEQTENPYYELKLGDWSATTSLSRYRQYRQDGKAILAQVACPVGLFIGSQDGNVDPATVREIGRLRDEGGAYANVSTKILEGLEHSFREVVPGESFVDVMRKPISDAYKQTLRDFVWEQLNL